MADNDVTRIAGNIGAMNALYSLNNINKQLSIHQTRLATGKRINSAADDPAGLAISTKLMSRSEGLKTALSNIGDAKNLLAVAESGLGRLTDILNSMRTITENAANDTNGTEERKIVKEQLASYAQQINDIVAQTKWSDKKLISGAYDDNSLTFQTGADFGETTKLDGLEDMQASALALLTTFTAAASAAIAGSLGSDYTVSLGAVASGVTEAATGSGTYTVQINVALDSDGGQVYTAQLMNGSATVGAAQTGVYSLSTTTAVDFQNGIVFNMASNLWGGGTAATLSSGASALVTVSAIVGSTTPLADGTYSVSASIADGIYTVTILDDDSAEVTQMTGVYTDAAVSVNFGNGLTYSLAAGLVSDAAVSASATDAGLNVGITLATSEVSGSQFAGGTYSLSGTLGSDGSYTFNVLDSVGGTAYTTTGSGYDTATPLEIVTGSGLTFTLSNVDNSDDVTFTGDITYVASSPATYDTVTTTAEFGFTAATPDSFQGATTSAAFSYTASVAESGGEVAINYTVVGTEEISYAADFAAYMQKIDAAMVKVNSQLSKIGSLTGSLTFKEDQVSSSQINIEASYNRIMNANMAEEQVNASKLLILQQTSTAMLAQANAAPQFLLSLFK